MENNGKYKSTSAGSMALLAGITLGFAALLVLFYDLGMERPGLAGLCCFYGMLVIVIGLMNTPKNSH